MLTSSCPETNENSATKARRHKEFIYNKTFFVTLCLGVLVAILMVAPEPHPEKEEKKENIDWKMLLFFFVCVNVSGLKKHNAKYNILFI